jgi:hypothetical protein
VVVLEWKRSDGGFGLEQERSGGGFGMEEERRGGGLGSFSFEVVVLEVGMQEERRAVVLDWTRASACCEWIPPTTSVLVY